MSFTERQLQGLHAMGLVAWTCDSGASFQLENVEEQPLAEAEPESETDARAQSSGVVIDKPMRSEVSFDQLPISLEATTQWLVTQSLAQMPYRGTNVACIGPEQASLLVVCLHSESKVNSPPTSPPTSPLTSPPTSPLTSDSAQLFDLMMRSIDMQRSECKQCAISTHLSTGESSDLAPVFLEDILLPQTRAVLVLDPRSSAFADDDGIDKALLPGSSLPLWRTPHPELLLAKPLLKRCAWESLKSLRRTLNSTMRP